MYQYLSWFKRAQAYPSGNKLLSTDAINKLKSTLLTSGVEVHESVQRYDSLGRVQFTPIYADFDGEDSTDDVLKFIRHCNLEFNITPDIYFSGNRGHHLFINVPVSHAYPHLVVKKFMNTMTESKYLDTQMYSSRHLLRSEGSLHFKTNLYKTRITLDELDAGIGRDKARKQSLSQPTHHESRSLDLFLLGLGQLIDKEVKEAEEKYQSIKTELKGEVPPCIKALIAQGPVAGQNNNIITLIARSFNQSNIALDDALAEVTSRVEWVGHVKEITSVFKSIYRAPSRFGCKNNKTLREFCDPFCPFNEETISIM
jgi:hypothetical protein